MSVKGVKPDDPSLSEVIFVLTKYNSKVSQVFPKATAVQQKRLLELGSGFLENHQPIRPRYVDPKRLQELGNVCEEILRQHSERAETKELRRKRYAKRHKQI